MNREDGEAQLYLECVRLNRRYEDAKKLPPRSLRDVPEDARGDGADLRRRLGGAVEHAPRRGDVLGLQAQARQPDVAALPGARRATTWTATSGTSRGRASRRRFDEFRTRGATVDESGVSRAARDRARRHRRDGVPRLLPDRLGLHPRGEGARHPGGPGPRLGRGLARRLRARHHGHRSDPVQPAVRALPEPRARQHAGLRHRLLHVAARRGHRLRRARSTARRASGRSPPSRT